MPTPYEQPEPLGPVSGIEPVELKNFASNEKVCSDIRKFITILNKARDNRYTKVERDWERYRDVYNMRRSLSFYDGRSKLFLGVLKDAVDTLVRIAKDSILSDPYISVETPLPGKFKDVAVDFYRSLLEDQAHIRSKVSMLLRQLYIVGTTCLKFGWEEVTRNVKYREKQEDGSLEIKTKKQYECYGPTLNVVDMSHVYVWPETATDYLGLRMVWEDSITTFDKLRIKAKKGWYDEASVEIAISNRIATLEEKKKSLSQSSKETGHTTTLAEDELDIVELWVKYRLPDAEKDEDEAWVWVTYCGEEILRVQANPWWFNVPPYLFGALFREHDYFYGHGIVEGLEMWQYMANDLVNQTMDSTTYSINGIAIFDPNLVDDPDLYQFEPMAKWLINPEAVKFERPPSQLSMEGLNMVRFLINIMQDQSKANAIVSGSPREGLGRAVGTATGVSTMAASGNAAVLDQVEELETQIFTPLLKMNEIASHQFMEDAMIIRKMGPDGALLTDAIIEPQDLVLSSDIRWVASIRMKEKLSKSQQMLNLLNIAVGIPPEIQRAQGFKINYKDLLIDTAAGIGAESATKYVTDLTVSLPGIPPELERELCDAGRQVEAPAGMPIEFYVARIQAHMSLPIPNSPLAKLRIMELIRSYQAQLEAAQQMQLMQMQQAQGGPGMMPGTPGGAARGPVGGGMPVRPQEMPNGSSEGEAGAGLMSMLGGNTGQ
jgi:hypothetical protein